mgnify:FL=1
MTIGNNILALLYQRDISQKQMAIDLDIAPSTLNGYINARREPDYDTLIKFAQYFQVSCDYLLGNSLSPTPSSEESDNQTLPFTLDKQELLLLNYFKSLTPNQMELIMSQVKLMHKQNLREQKSESVSTKKTLK